MPQPDKDKEKKEDSPHKLNRWAELANAIFLAPKRLLCGK